MRRWAWAFLAVLALGLSFQGTRGLWEPDEGYYSNVALRMVHGEDWLVPRLNGEAFLDKPPLLYWIMALGVKALGATEWGLRAGNAVAFGAAAVWIGLLAARWWGQRVGTLAVFVYATSVGPFLAANVITPDTLLAASVTGVYYAFWRERTTVPGSRSRWAWAMLLGTLLGLGALAKGPAILVFAAPLVPLALHNRWRGGPRLGPLFFASVVFLGIALPWYFAIAENLPGAADYLYQSQVSGRLFSTALERNSGPWGGPKVYLPTLVVGTLPWGLLLLAGFSRLGAVLRGLRSRSWALPSPAGLLLLWLLLPLLVLFVARSRLPLYVLPLFAPLTLIAARLLAGFWPTTPRGRRFATAACVLWVGLLVAGKATVGHLPFGKDSRQLAADLREAGAVSDEPLVLIDAKRNGLTLYGWTELQQATFDPTPYPFFHPPKPIREVIEACRRERRRMVFLASPGKTASLTDLLRDSALPFRTAELERYVLFFVGDPLPSAGRSTALGSATPAAVQVAATGTAAPGEPR